MTGLLEIAALVVFDQLFPMALFVAAWGTVISAVAVIAIVVGLITHAIDDPEAA